MKRVLILTIMLSIFGFGKSNAQKKQPPKKSNTTEEYNGIIGRCYENDLPVIMKFINELPEKKIMVKFPFLTVISWEYEGNGNNGMPKDEINKRMIELEDTMESSMETSEIFTHAYSRTGNNLKEFAYYTTSQDDFMTMLNRALERHAEYPIGINIYEDKEWADFKKVIEDFKK